MSSNRSVLAVALAAAAFGAGASSASADVVRSCPGNHPFGNTGMWYGDMSARNMTCAAARRLLARGSYRHPVAVVPGFSCKHIGNYGDGGIFRCVSGRRAIRFSAGG